jgi:hypothetical protein
MIGNLLKNGGFEETDDSGEQAVSWKGDSDQNKPVNAADLGLGLGKNVFKFNKCENWSHVGQDIKIPGGHAYLYTAWVWNQGIGGGSNLNQTMKDGTKKSIYNNGVINIGQSTEYWKMFMCRYKAPANLAKAAFTPVAKGSGFAYYDNLRVTVFEGTDYAAEAYRTDKAPKIDGKLDDWIRACPLPFIGANQLTKVKDGVKFDPRDLNAVGYLMWDSANLYLAMEVLDDTHKAFGEGKEVINADSLIMAFDPTNRSIEAKNKAFMYYVSSANPGAGGTATLYRPKEYSAGLRSGQLARDSSIYELAVKADGGKTYYEIRMPFTELGLTPIFGGKIAMTLQLNDNDGTGLESFMIWGGGLKPVWLPENFGVITFVE